MRTYTDEECRERARNLFPRDGDPEFDEDCKVLQYNEEGSPKGAYVQGWVWVEFNEEEEPTYCSSEATLVDGTFLCDLPEGHEGGHTYARTCQRGAG
jgi:hypothetical protein